MDILKFEKWNISVPILVHHLSDNERIAWPNFPENEFEVMVGNEIKRCQYSEIPRLAPVKLPFEGFAPFLLNHMLSSGMVKPI